MGLPYASRMGFPSVSRPASTVFVSSVIGAPSPNSSSGPTSPPAAANAKDAKAPAARQSPYARAAHEDAMAENAAMAQMQAKGQPLPPRLSHGSGPAAAKGSKASH